MTTFLIIVAMLAAVLVCLHLLWSPPDMSQYDEPEDPLVIEPGEVSAQHQDVVATLAAYHGESVATDIATGRKRFEALFTRDVNASIEPVDAAGVPAEWILAEGANPDRRVLYIHGGAFMVGSPKTHRFITSELSRRASAAVLAIDYRMQPEFKTIHCHEDAQAAYQWILANGPGRSGPPERLFVAGDSAGGNLTLSVIAWARQNNLRAADGAIALAPLTDATLSSPTWRANVGSDPFLGPSIGRLFRIPGIVRMIIGRLQNGKAAKDPLLSPLFGDLGGLPPTLIQASRDEMLYGDAQRYANKARSEGSEVILQVWPTLVHVFQGFDKLPEAHDALDRAATFISERSADTA